MKKLLVLTALIYFPFCIAMQPDDAKPKRASLQATSTRNVRTNSRESSNSLFVTTAAAAAQTQPTIQSSRTSSNIDVSKAFNEPETIESLKIQLAALISRNELLQTDNIRLRQERNFERTRATDQEKIAQQGRQTAEQYRLMADHAQAQIKNSKNHAKYHERAHFKNIVDQQNQTIKELKQHFDALKKDCIELEKYNKKSEHDTKKLKKVIREKDALIVQLQQENIKLQEAKQALNNSLEQALDDNYTFARHLAKLDPSLDKEINERLAKNNND